MIFVLAFYLLWSDQFFSPAIEGKPPEDFGTLQTIVFFSTPPFFANRVCPTSNEVLLYDRPITAISSYCRPPSKFDDCSEAFRINNVIEFCSKDGMFDNLSATASNVQLPDCFPKEKEFFDIWFSFVARTSCVNMVVQGDTEHISGSAKLAKPQLALYSGDCGNLKKMACISDGYGKNYVQATVGNLEVGRMYYIRVGGREGKKGRFQLCINSFNPAKEEYPADCQNSIVLCDKSSFVVPKLTTAGSELNESDGHCTLKECRVSEHQSVWFRWTCEQSGSLLFKLTPLTKEDDLDFILFELSDINSCTSKYAIRCMAAGEEAGMPWWAWKACTGSTGLRKTETDVHEYCGCDKPNNNFLKPLNMSANKSYALLVTNYSSSGTGFHIEFDGTGTFVRSYKNCLEKVNTSPLPKTKVHP